MPLNHLMKIVLAGTAGAVWLSIPAKAQIVHVAVETRDVLNRMEATGKVTPAESSEISPTRDLVIKRFLVLPGQAVKKRQKLAEIDIKSVASELKYLTPYQEVAGRNVQLAEINMQVAREKLERTEILAAKGIVKESDLDQAKSSAALAVRTYESSLANLADAQSRIKEVNARLSEVALVAPQNGVVTKMIVDPRQLSGVFYARTGSDLFRIDQPGTYKITVRMSDRDFLRLDAFPRCEVRLPGNSALPCTLIPSTGVPERSPDSVAAVFPVAARFNFNTSTIPFGMEATLSLSAAKPEKKLVVPWNAVEVEPGNTFVRKKGADYKDRTAVTLGWRDGHYVEILSGLKQGDMVEARVWPPVKLKK